MSMPSKDAIAAYWSTVPVEWSDGTIAPDEYGVHYCWACRYDVADCGPLERAHLVPRALGGGAEPSNLVLLCASCHRKAPNVDDRTYMLEWVNGYAERETQRVVAMVAEVCEKVVARLGGKDEANKMLARLDVPGLHKRAGALLEVGATTHFGEGLNAATLAWAYERAIEEATGEEVAALAS